MNPILLLTGATGFVGRQVIKSLAKQPVRIRVVVREGKDREIEKADNIESVVVTSDLFAESQSWFEEVCRDVDIVIHVAWYAEPGKYLQSPINLDCLTGTLVLAKACAAVGVRRFVGVGTCFEYDLACGHLSVETPLRPLVPYSGAKAAAFVALQSYFAEAGVEFVWCRLFYLYGEGEDERRLVPYVHRQLAKGESVQLTRGDQVRDFMNVADAGYRIAEIALGDFNGPVNICSGIGTTVKALVEKIADEYGRRDLLVFGSRQDNFIDPPCVVGVL